MVCSACVNAAALVFSDHLFLLVLGLLKSVLIKLKSGY